MINSTDIQYFKNFGSYHGVNFDRKLVDETAFDGIVKIYSVTTDNENINNQIRSKFFHGFVYPTKRGLLMRMYDYQNSWPYTNLIHIEIPSGKIEIIKKTNSSYDTWTVDENEPEIIVNISPKEKVSFENN